jgi:hypothetical protein
VTVPLEPPRVPQPFAAAVEALHGALEATGRQGVTLREVPGPKRLAPYSFAVAAEVTRDGEEIASGRLVVLHDPAGQEGWRGDTRVVAFVSAEVEAEMAADAALAEVGWSWLTEALQGRGAAHTAAGGTVTRTVSSRFGQLAEPAEASEVEIRASWTALLDPEGRLDLRAHLGAWSDLLRAAAGLPPTGVVSLPARSS